jgi:hypothetical protein
MHPRCAARSRRAASTRRASVAHRITMQQAVRDALIAFIAVTAQAQAEATKPAQGAGIDHKRRAQPNTYLGRKPSYDRQRSRVSGLRSTAPTRRAYPPSRRPRALASRRPFASSRTRCRRGRVGCMGLVTANARALRDATPRFCAAFLEPLSVDPKSEKLPSRFKKGRLEAARCLGPSVFAPGAPIGCAARMPAAARLTGQVRVSGCQSVAGCLN